MFYKIVENDYITMLGWPNVPSTGVEISEEKYHTLIAEMDNKPQDTLESVYRLSNKTEKYIACERTHDEIVDWYVQEIVDGNITIEDVPEEYKEEVTAKLPTPEVDPYQQGYDQAVLDCIEGGIL